MGFRVGQNRRAPHFGPGACRGGHGDDRRDGVGIGAGPPIAHILVIPHRPRLSRHEGDHLAQIKAGTTAKGDHTVMPALAVDLQPRLEVQLGRVCVHFREHRTAKACAVQQVQRARRDLHRGKALVRHQQGVFHPRGHAGLSDFRNTARAKADGGGVGPVVLQCHKDQAFFRW